MKQKEIILQTTNSTESFDPIVGPRLGKIAQITKEGKVLVNFVENIQEIPIPAILTRSLDMEHLQKALKNQRSVVLLFEENHPSFPVIMDVTYSLLNDVLQNSSAKKRNPPENVSQNLHWKARKIHFEAEEGFTLTCGKSSVACNQDGQVEIRGRDLLSFATGVNKIKGGNISLN